MRTSGTATVVAGLSCISCHRNGMIGGFEDKVREGNAVAGEARGKVERLYPRKGEMDRLLSQDEDRFLAALTKATAARSSRRATTRQSQSATSPSRSAVSGTALPEGPRAGRDRRRVRIAEPKDLQSLILVQPAAAAGPGSAAPAGQTDQHGLGVVTIRRSPFPRGGEPTGAGDTAA